MKQSRSIHAILAAGREKHNDADATAMTRMQHKIR